MEIRDIGFEKNGKYLYARLLLPENGRVPYPAVILSHGFNGSGEHGMPYAEEFLKAGAACVLFDFIGGSVDSRSGGRMEEMSVLTELADLQALMSRIQPIPEIDGGRVFLFGRSQGGLVSAMAAARQPEAVRGLILLYPAFNLPDKAREMYPDPDNVPGRIEILDAVVGRDYYDALTALNIEDLQRTYSGPVLIIQGQRDDVVPPGTAEAAARNYPDCRLIRIPDGGHGFSGEDFSTAAEESVRFMNAVLLGGNAGAGAGMRDCTEACPYNMIKNKPEEGEGSAGQ